MSDKSDSDNGKVETAFSRQVGAMAERKLKSQHDTGHGVWFGLGMTGLIGWSVVVPTLLGIALGIWLDKHYQGSHSWTLTLLIVGLAIGCLNAWHWIAQEDLEMHDQEGDKHE